MRPPLAYRFLKRSLDVTVAFVMLAVLGPLLLLIAAAIKVEDRHGPVFFAQERTGLGGRRFGVLKFRTMVANAEELKEQLRQAGPAS